MLSPGRHIDDTTRDPALEAVAAGRGQIRACLRCGHAYYTIRGAGTCWPCWYAIELESYAARYSDVIEDLTSEGFTVSVDQTGGMCMALRLTHPALPDGWWWLTDQHDTLSYERDIEDGWMLGRYLDDDEGDGLPVSTLVAEYKTIGMAVALARADLEALTKETQP
jgi:hypothetical protein